MSANVARTIDPGAGPDLHVRTVERDAHHNEVLCIVAAHLAGRAWTTLRRSQPYVRPMVITCQPDADDPGRVGREQDARASQYAGFTGRAPTD
jgi:hypothetical protein